MEPQSVAATDSSRDKIVQLFALQAQCGMWGIILGVAWILGVIGSIDDVFPKGSRAYTVFGIIAFLFAAAVVLSVSYLYAPKKRGTFISDNAATLLHACSVFCILAICILIWATGGIHSPFTPFYVMTFTLTLERIEEGTNKWGIFLGFVVPIVGICLLERFLFGSLIETAMLNKILADTFYYSAVVFGVVLSMFVPTLSAWLEAYFRKTGTQA